MERVNPPPEASPFVKTTMDSMPGRATQECASSFVKTTADKAGKCRPRNFRLPPKKGCVFAFAVQAEKD